MSAAAINRYGLPEGQFREDLDALAAAQFRPSDDVVMVGAFIPFIKTLRGRVAKLQIVDKHAEALNPSERSMWVPPESATDTLAKASVAIVSGSALVEGGIEELLAAAALVRIRIMAGPTTPSGPAHFSRAALTSWVASEPGTAGSYSTSLAKAAPDISSSRPQKSVASSDPRLVQVREWQSHDIQKI